MLRTFSLALLTLTLAISGQAEAPASSDSGDATGYFRPGAIVPASADMSRGDVPRDAYGRPYTYEALGQKLPTFSAPFTDGATFSTDQLLGRWTVIEIWGIWCHDSRNDAPYAAALSSALAQDPNVDFMSIHTPQNAARANKALKGHSSVSAWFETKGWHFPTVMDEDASLREALRIRWTPTYLVIAPDLTVQGFRTGLADAGDQAVKDFVRDIAATRADWGAS